MDFNAIKEAVAKSHYAGQQATKDGCECGGNYDFACQSIIYSEQDKSMADRMTYTCKKCGKEKSVIIPLHGEVYQKMAERLKKM